jgi:hypothetical protein
MKDYTRRSFFAQLPTNVGIVLHHSIYRTLELVRRVERLQLTICCYTAIWQ